MQQGEKHVFPIISTTSHDSIICRYRANNDMLKRGMAEMGFRRLYNDTENPNGYISTAFFIPVNPLFVYREFRNRLSDYGKMVYLAIFL